MAAHHKNKQHFHEIRMLQSIFHEKIDGYIRSLHKRGWIELDEKGEMFYLTQEGYKQAEAIHNQINSVEI